MNNFVWTDLSTFDVAGCKNFYSTIFNWKFNSTTDQSMSELYEIAYQGRTPVSAVFVMPEYLQKINMPSFWMSYVRVTNIEKVLAKARTIEGVIIEVEPTPFDAHSQIALIRDPSGAGFTVYQGPDLQGRFTSGHGRPVWNVHHSKDVEQVREFYKVLFGWTIEATDQKGTFHLKHESGEVIATLEEHPDDIRGQKSYWMPIFEVADVSATQKQVEKLGGALVHKISGATMLVDQQGGHFLVQKNDGARTITKQSMDRKPILWKTVGMLFLIITALALDLGEFVFGALFLWWTYKAVRLGSVYVVEPVRRDAYPILFWSVVGLYLVLSVYSVFTILKT